MNRRELLQSAAAGIAGAVVTCEEALPEPLMVKVKLEYEADDEMREHIITSFKREFRGTPLENCLICICTPGNDVTIERRPA